ncbi:ATP-binding cassette domain-containing protein [Streptomyces prunicolor]|uniref:ATP-binding cassette domain-containing protein n=1 Tax=Streptomyces prunicolor TaxID=67348 RepID=UPI002B1D3915|nr:ATP-binding cassette domain-containing protein [Streptomyces prunicolor]
MKTTYEHRLPTGRPERRPGLPIRVQDLGLLTFLNAWENVVAAFGPRLSRHRTAARALLGDFGMEQLADFPATELSGGQRQRIAVARAAVKEPVLVLADEPTSGLDPKNANSVMSSLRSCAERGAAVLLVTHSAAVAEVCDQRCVLDDGVLSGVREEDLRQGSVRGETLG